MKIFLITRISIALWVLSALTAHAAETYVIAGKVFFSPNGGAQTAIVEQIQNAKSSVYVQAYSFTSKPIIEALVRAQKRGVSVIAILDKSNLSQRYTAADLIDHFGVGTLIDNKHKIAHNKVMIIDQEIVITGSFNFSKAAEEDNAENLLVLRSSQLADVYYQSWEMHLKHSDPYIGKDR